jgi:nitrite reductase/ring-hydroxylating ferredoxin subunit/uncharacterized membrane protein
MIERWARPFRGFSNGTAALVRGFYGALGGPGRLLQDFLNGSWLGHSLHAVLVDVVIGAATVAVILDLLRVIFGLDELADAATWTTLLVFLSALGAIVTGLTDHKDTSSDTPLRDVGALHGLINIVATIGFGISLWLRLVDAHDAGFWAMLLSYLVVSAGGFIGGHIVFKYGYMVNYNAFSKGKRAAEFTAVAPVSEVPENAPTKITFGATSIMLVRRGEVVHALKDTCSHQGGPLSQGELKGDTITCPWHFSVFRITDGAVIHGPASSRQVRYEARVNEGQVEIQGPYD